MKKIIFLPILALALTSCYKEYNCTCVVDGDASGTTVIKGQVKAVSEDRAHEKCNKMEVAGESCSARQ